MKQVRCRRPTPKSATRMLTLISMMILAAGALQMASLAAPAYAGSAWWHVETAVAPANLPLGSEGDIELTVTNLGDTATAGTGGPITIKDALPAGLEATEIRDGFPGTPDPTEVRAGVTCTLAQLSCEYGGVFAPYAATIVVIKVKAVSAPTAPNVVTVTGGGAPPIAASEPVVVSSVQPGFGFRQFDLAPLNEDGSLDTQAGSHPFALTAALSVNQELRTEQGEQVPAPTRAAKNLRFTLPSGLVGNPTVIPHCTIPDFTATSFEGETLSFSNLCPSDTAIGVAEVKVATSIDGFNGPGVDTVPVFNLTPSTGEPARFGFVAEGVRVYLDTSVRTGAGYNVVVDVRAPQIARLFGAILTFWGVPANGQHDSARGWDCLVEGRGKVRGESCNESREQAPTAFLTLPTDCSAEAFSATAEGESWEEPTAPPATSRSVLRDSFGRSLGLDGCDALNFAPALTVSPDGQAANSPTGLEVDLHVPQLETVNPSGLGQANVRSTAVTLPTGLLLSPAGAGGLASCSVSEIGFRGVNAVTGEGEFTTEPPTCPEAAKIATVRIKTPLLPNALDGAIYLAAPQNFAGGPLENPFRTLIAAYIVAEDPVSGVLVKLPGNVSTNPVSGQVTATFESPQLPFEDAEFHFFGGSRAPLTTPSTCGSYTTTASITPWSGSRAAEPASTFEITSGPNGAPCASPLPFAPGFQAGTTNLQAGAFTPFTLTMSRPDGDQALAGISMHMPPGLLGMISSVKLCGEPQASQGTCGPESLIGETIVSAGLGPDPYTVTGGKVYITTGYKGAPYGLSIVNPAKAGPFILDEGRPVIVRAAINVDPRTAQLTVTSDPLPTILDGIPLQIQHVNVAINRPGFTFNGTDCNPLGITGTLTSQEGATAGVSSPFQITNCATLAYKPSLSVATGARTSRANGASLSFKIAYPKGAQGSQSWFREAKFDLPKQLPSRLTTLQKACLAATFEHDRAACPAASQIGTASVSTPVLASKLTGTVYFVSYGGAQFPEAVIVLHGEGITIELHGETFINSKGITSATFKSLPDVPFNSIEVTLPTGKYSEFAGYLPAKAHNSFCGQKLTMPTRLVAQNGLEIKQNTPVTVTGCPKVHKAKKRKSKHRKKHHGKGKRK